MKNKLLVLDRIEKIRNKIKNTIYLVNTNGSFNDIDASFNELYEVLDNMENLVSIEEDPYRSNQLI